VTLCVCVCVCVCLCVCEELLVFGSGGRRGALCFRIWALVFAIHSEFWFTIITIHLAFPRGRSVGDWDRLASGCPVILSFHFLIIFILVHFGLGPVLTERLQLTC
jgi:hypothetical protein